MADAPECGYRWQTPPLKHRCIKPLGHAKSSKHLCACGATTK